MSEIYMGALPFGADEKWIRSLVAPYGKVIAIELHADWKEPRHEPFAVVTLESANVEALVNDLDGRKTGFTHLRVHRRVKLPVESRW